MTSALYIHTLTIGLAVINFEYLLLFTAQFSGVFRGGGGGGGGGLRGSGTPLRLKNEYN